MLIVVLLDKVVVVVIFRVGRREIMIQRGRRRHDRRSIYEIVWWLIFCAEADIAYEIALLVNLETTTNGGAKTKQSTHLPW